LIEHVLSMIPLLKFVIYYWYHLYCAISADR